MKFWQSHNCNGYRAEITIEWSVPEGVELLPERAAAAEEIADESLSVLARRPFELVQAMQGRHSR